MVEVLARLGSAAQLATAGSPDYTRRLEAAPPHVDIFLSAASVSVQVRERLAAQDAAGASRASVEEARAEHAKDKAFVLAVISTLRDQLAAERAERETLRAEASARQAAQTEALAAERAAHDKALGLASQAARAEAAAEMRLACRELHASMSGFCDKWVPSGAEQERLALLGRLTELAHSNDPQ